MSFVRARLVAASLFIAGSAVVFTGANAQNSKESVRQSATEGALRSTLTDGFPAPSFGNLKFNASIKSLNTSGRIEELQSEHGRRLRLKTEYAVGGVATGGALKGWGLTGTAVTSGAIHSDSEKTSIGAGDPSVILVHPPFYESDDLKVSGQLRRYFAVSDRARNRGTEHYAYYVTTTVKMARGWSVFNQVAPRYFFQRYYQPTDTNLYLEDFGGVSKQMFSWLKLGVGGHASMEMHADTPTGRYAEMFPFASFTVSRNVLIEPRVYLPLYKVNSVNESARSVSLNNAQAELYAQISL